MSDLLAFLLILVFTLLCGFNDGGNLLATFLSTRTVRAAVVLVMLLAACVVGPWLVGTAVARAIGTQMVDVRTAGMTVFNAGIGAALITLLASWRLKMPTSTSFALVGGLAGAGLVDLGPAGVLWHGLVTILMSLFLAVLLGGVTGFIVYASIRRALRSASFRMGVRVGYLQYISAALLCFGYAANDAEKSIGLLATVWMLWRHQAVFHVDWWMVVLLTLVFGLGLLTGGLRVARTVGHHIFSARPVHAVAMQFAASLVVLTASALGGPVSSTQTIDSALVGVGVRTSKSRVRWEVVHRLGLVWLTTLPASFLVAAMLALCVKWFRVLWLGG
ncbi:MAG: inorganic phosphate transporter [Alicyclobacillus sp.]|nr:inorganic phosphate transporter [Alicyclobacillus sp.]